MKVSRAQAEANREKVIDSSSRLFRERGFAGVGLNELMHAAGLTRGGFYGQFESKQDLIGLALARALQENLERWQGVVAKARNDPLRAFVQSYLSDIHAEQVNVGCALAALAPDAEREGETVREVFGEGARELAQLIDSMLPVQDGAKRNDRSWALLAGLVGAVALSRAVADEEDAKAIRRATAEMLLSLEQGAGKSPARSKPRVAKAT